VRLLICNWRDLAHPAAGGAEVWTEMVARHLAGKGHDVTLFAAAVRGRTEREQVEGVRIVRRGSRLGVYREARRFWSEEDGKFDVVVDEINTRPFMAPRFASGTPVVAVAHQVAREVWFEEAPFPISVVGRYVLEPWWLRSYADVPTLTLSPSSAASLHAYGLRDVRAITPGSDERDVRPRQKEAVPTIAFLGRLVPSKRPDHVVEAFRIVRRTHPEARLWILGDGRMGRALARSAGEGVELFGRVTPEERDDRLGRAHLLVATSVREGWNLTVSEAAALGTPCIGYDVCGLTDSIPRSGGHLVPESPEALAAAVTAHLEGRLPLEPRISTSPWDEVGDAVEAVLMEQVGRHVKGVG
jgi:glycosyltransferase involved in cell wall biosynthesis